jgi:hypothetical protein
VQGLEFGVYGYFGSYYAVPTVSWVCVEEEKMYLHTPRTDKPPPRPYIVYIHKSLEGWCSGGGSRGVGMVEAQPSVRIGKLRPWDGA